MGYVVRGSLLLLLLFVPHDSLAVEYIGTDVSVKFGDSRSNPIQDIRVAHFVMDDANAGRHPTDLVVMAERRKSFCLMNGFERAVGSDR